MHRRGAIRRQSGIVGDQDDLEHAKALSLVTAKLDELRRTQLHASAETIPRCVSPATTGMRACHSDPRLDEDPPPTNLISRPRPQPLRIGSPTIPRRVTPTPPPRPKSKPLRKSLCKPLPRPPPPLPSVRPNAMTLPTKLDPEPPLIQLSPTRVPFANLDFDISNFDPLHHSFSFEPSFSSDLSTLKNLGQTSSNIKKPSDNSDTSSIAFDNVSFYTPDNATAHINDSPFDTLINTSDVSSKKLQGASLSFSTPWTMPDFFKADIDLNDSASSLSITQPISLADSGHVRCDLSQGVAMFTTEPHITESSDSEDLMQFSAHGTLSGIDSEFISLRSFDPLYSTPGGAIAASQTATQSSEFSVDLSGSFNQSREARLFSDESNMSDNQPSATTPTSDQPNTELQDPFCMTDLTLALERKRQEHELHRRNRKAVMRKKGKTEGEVTVKTHRRTASNLSKGQECTYESLRGHDERADEEIVAFCQMVSRVKQKYAHDDISTNPGIVFSPRFPRIHLPVMSVKLVVTATFLKEAAVFTCDLSSSVDHVISYVLLSIADDLGDTSTDSYMVKVQGLSEYMINDSVLGEYEYVHQCLKLDEDIQLCLMETNQVNRSLQRTSDDDQHLVFVPKSPEVDEPMKVTREKLNILMETFYKEVEKLRDQAMQGRCLTSQTSGVVQSVKAICAVLHKIETNDVIAALQRLRSVTAAMKGSGDAKVPSVITTINRSANKRESFVYLTTEEEDEELDESPCEITNKAHSMMDGDIQMDGLHMTLEELTRSIKNMVELFCRTFHTDFSFESAKNHQKDHKSAREFSDDIIVHIATINRVPTDWFTTYERFKLVCQLYYAGRQLAQEVVSETPCSESGNLQATVVWDEWLQFEGVPVRSLPRESRLCFTLVGVRCIPSTSDQMPHLVNTPLGWVSMLLYDHKFELMQCSHLLGLWPGHVAMPTGTTSSNIHSTPCVMLQINLPDFDCVVSFPAIHERLPSMLQDFSSLHPDDQRQLQSILSKDSITRLSESESEVLWEKRYYLGAIPSALPRVLQASTDWQYTQLTELYSMLHSWTRLSPLTALKLLLPSFADTYVRAAAVNYMQSLSNDELVDYLPQLVQAIKFENYHTGMLAQFLLECSLESVRIAHQLYWMLREAADDVHFRKRYQLLFGALLSVVGAAMREELSREENFARSLGVIAQQVKTAGVGDKANALHRELMNLWEGLDRPAALRLPLSPEMEVCGFDVKSCSYFSSNAFPLRLVLRNVDKQAESLYVMFKVGDDLRQDMLTMQIIRIMDKLWLQHGLDLKVITFRCQATGVKRGLVQLITETETLRKIQVKQGHGFAGPLKGSTISEWLKVQNPTELEFDKAVDNFTCSCAAYCVATYILGICDRHNDNIMVRQSGHLFHIDFAKFLGDSQMFGNIKRDRVPFVLSPDMAYVINGGDRPSERFQHFVDLCCHAFNTIRSHSSMFLDLFSLMTLSNIPGVNYNAVKYIQRALLSDHTEAEATAMFTRMIDDCLKSSFTQFNFILHNLAQMKFSGHKEGAMFSFTSKTYSIQTDGRISNIEIYGYQKRYNPEKYYIYILKVDREKQAVPSFVFRRYSEFQELYHALVVTFPLVKLPALSGKVILGRTHVKTVAAERKAAVQTFLHQLFRLSSEISEHDIIYTFFHPMLRDEQDVDKTNLQKLKEPSPPCTTQSRRVGGQIKLSLFYKNGEFTVMVRHVKDLVCDQQPDPYVKLYLLPDQTKITKRKTKIAKATFHPTYNEMLIYRMSQAEVSQRTLQVSVWNYDPLKENEFLGAVRIKLCDVDLEQENTRWYRLRALYMAGAPQ